MRDMMVAHELAEASLFGAIRDLRMNMRVIAGDPTAIAMLHYDLALLSKTVDDIKEMAQKAVA
jgi:hypothetical protein